jgi:hypothetical protein
VKSRRNWLGRAKTASASNDSASQRGASVVLLGLGLSLGQLLQTGLESFPVMIGTFLRVLAALLDVRGARTTLSSNGKQRPKPP